MNRLSDLMYTQPQQQEEPLFPDINQQIRYGMQYAQNTLKPKSYWDYRLKMNDFETPDDEFANKYRLQGSPTPAVAPGPSFKGQVGTTVMPSAQEASLRAKLRERGLPADQIDAMVLQHKAAQGLR